MRVPTAGGAGSVILDLSATFTEDLVNGKGRAAAIHPTKDVLYYLHVRTKSASNQIGRSASNTKAYRVAFVGVVTQYRIPSSGVISPSQGKDIFSIPLFSAYNDLGEMRFCPDGFLYIGTGHAIPNNDDGKDNAKPTSLNGKILRLDVDSASLIPPGNPFIGTPIRPEVFATGLRLPWGFDWGVDNHWWVSDVGSAIEEINVVKAGKKLRFQRT